MNTMFSALSVKCCTTQTLRILRRAPDGRFGLPLQQIAQQTGSMRIGVLGENASACRDSQLTRSLDRQRRQQFDQFVARPYAEHLDSGLEKFLDALPCITDQTCLGAGRLEDSR